jgi:hypothetical protein
MSLRLNGSTSGYVEIDAPATAGSNTLTLPDGNGSSGQVLSTDGSGALSFVDRMTAAGPAFRAYPNANTAFTSNTLTKISFQVEEFDTNSCYDTSNSRFTPTVAGYYQVSGTVRADIAGQTALHIYIAKNGSSYASGDFMNATTSARSSHISALVPVNGSSDYIEIYCFSGTAGNLYVDTVNTWFSAHLARPA